MAMPCVLFSFCVVLGMLSCEGSNPIPVHPACNCSCELDNLDVIHAISEKNRTGLVIFNATSSTKTIYSITHVQPVQLTAYFHVENNSTGRLLYPIDVEGIYLTQKIKLYYIILTVTCHKAQDIYERDFNITIEDEDDNVPMFSNTDRKSCTIPGYNAKADQNYMGILETTPGIIRAADGDALINNIIQYSIMYGEPTDFHRYFEINVSQGFVNKTANVTDSEPHDYVLFIKATEVSVESKSKIAFLRVTMTKYETTETPPVTVDNTVLLVLRIASGVIILGFTAAFAVIIRHRMRKYRESKRTRPVPDDLSVTSPRFADLELVKEDSFLKENTIVLKDNRGSEPVLTISNIE